MRDRIKKEVYMKDIFTSRVQIRLRNVFNNVILFLNKQFRGGLGKMYRK